MQFAFAFLDRFVAISDLYEPTDDGTDSQVRGRTFTDKKKMYHRVSVKNSITQFCFFYMITHCVVKVRYCVCICSDTAHVFILLVFELNHTSIARHTAQQTLHP